MRASRIRLLNVLAGAVVALLAASAAPAQARMVGIVLPRDCAFGEEVKDKFSSQFREMGFAAREVDVILQRPGADKVSRLNSMRKFLALGADVLVVWGGTALKELSQEAGKTPIVFVGAYDPVRDGIVANLQAPGKNVTGILGKSSMAYLVDNVLETSPFRTIGVIYHEGVTDSEAQYDDLKTVAAAKGVALKAVNVTGKEPAAVAAALEEAPFLFVAQGCAVEENAFANLAGLGKPAATQSSGVRGAGIVFNLAPNPDEMVREAASLAARILKGEKPGTIPIVRPKKIDFVINLNEAARFGLKIPFTVLSRATEVVK